MYSGNRLMYDRTEPLLDSRGRKSAHMLESCYISHLYEVLICVLLLSFVSFLAVFFLPKGTDVDEPMGDPDIPSTRLPHTAVHSTASRTPQGAILLCFVTCCCMCHAHGAVLCTVLSRWELWMPISPHTGRSLCCIPSHQPLWM